MQAQGAQASQQITPPQTPIQPQPVMYDQSQIMMATLRPGIYPQSYGQPALTPPQTPQGQPVSNCTLPYPRFLSLLRFADVLCVPSNPSTGSVHTSVSRWRIFISSAYEWSPLCSAHALSCLRCDRPAPLPSSWLQQSSSIQSRVRKPVHQTTLHRPIGAFQLQLGT